MKIVLEVSQKELDKVDMSADELDFLVGNYLDNAAIEFPAFIVEIDLKD